MPFEARQAAVHNADVRLADETFDQPRLLIMWTRGFRGPHPDGVRKFHAVTIFPDLSCRTSFVADMSQGRCAVAAGHACCCSRRAREQLRWPGVGGHQICPVTVTKRAPWSSRRVIRLASRCADRG